MSAGIVVARHVSVLCACFALQIPLQIPLHPATGSLPFFSQHTSLLRPDYRAMGFKSGLQCQLCSFLILLCLNMQFHEKAKRCATSPKTMT